MFLSVTLNGLMIGGLYVLMGTGFSLQWGISGIINLSFGSMTVLAAYLAFTLFSLLGIQPLITAIPIAGSDLSARSGGISLSPAPDPPQGSRCS